MKRRTRYLAVIAAALIGPATASAQTVLDSPYTISFVTPTGTVYSNEAIPVYLRLTLGAGATPLTTDGSSRITSGFDYSGYTGPIDLNDPNTQVQFNEYIACTGSFSCGDANYTLDFNFERPNLIGPTNLNLQPGDVFEWLLATYTPIAAGAAPGVYTLTDAGFFVSIFNPGADPESADDDQRGSLNSIGSCRSDASTCSTFTRTVLSAPGAVPEPATWAMMILGFGLVGAAVRRRPRQPVRGTFAYITLTDRRHA